ncbi:hypothetical protein [Pedobacter rhizosphaerae]|uniref:Uncharacterized protein n=1 Tax=Pedobacter rhizosphaerae TaxID=390241 RepID=A0A1H9NS29_9SPHI|nr:hypothetical protein [Pedobacter rhizosphaerae]SER38567.1 hypothetical protein SAMN04488023_10883 [Pedobacter rhizosphaerae]
MTVKSLKDEDKLPIKQVINAINKTMDDVLRVVDAMDLGRTEVKSDGVYRTFKDGRVIKISGGNFTKKRVSQKRIKLF